MRTVKVRALKTAYPERSHRQRDLTLGRVVRFGHQIRHLQGLRPAGMLQAHDHACSVCSRAVLAHLPFAFDAAERDFDADDGPM
jgi:hypothetical protein